MAALEALRWRPGHEQDDQDLMSTEGKGMVPRYDGEPSKLAEYSFRVKLLHTRFQHLDEAEAK